MQFKSVLKKKCLLPDNKSKDAQIELRIKFTNIRLYSTQDFMILYCDNTKRNSYI